MKHWISVAVLGRDYEKTFSISDQSYLILLVLLRFPKIQVEIAFHYSGKEQKKPNSTNCGSKHLLNGHTHLKVERCYTNTIYFSKMVLSWNTWVLQILIKYRASFWRNCSKKCHRRALRSEYLAQVLQTRQNLSLIFFYGCYSCESTDPKYFQLCCLKLTRWGYLPP